MLSLIEAFPNHLLETIEIFQGSQLKPADRAYDQIILTGLGGSGIGATIASDLLKDHAQLPIIINKDYHLPAFAGPGTLVIACSYSGNTEETLMAATQAEEKGCGIAYITSGGLIRQKAESNGNNLILIPGGNPPRAMLGYSLTALLLLLDHYGISYPDVKASIQRASRLLSDEVNLMKAEAKLLAENLHKKTPVTYSCEGFGGVATRWRQQLNENSKVVGWDAAIPEMNHNELVGWAGGDESFAVTFLRTDFDYGRNARRSELNRDLIKRYTPHVFEVGARGGDRLSQAFYLILFGDWVSYFLSELNGVDIVEVNVITELKDALSQF
ncbi:MAG: bifunctional phosphoglucose/phosphomannose isomerase [Bacteroidota bacterium]|nr:bifunctional phosphoglucose/phosphomannose isomerase [Bacteroidota bacterium]MDX5426708.1 bifunctional phosphoglucose/phosphomannose isomerase [Bacteroidota bacterium]MDX5448694.1 bifunctional phosphoglucose/phosphomannose isomerase [Bacteroidota bacterium]MDX5504708.1 bifunctional phosphoglucose/phosphomannose isomerase [Bacteroidota bacterium]